MSLPRRILIFQITALLCCAANTRAGVTIEPGTWQSTQNGTIVPSNHRVALPGQMIVESPGTSAAPPQYWKVVESSPRAPESSRPRSTRSGGGGGGSSVSQPPTPPRLPVKTRIGGVDVWVRIPALFLTLPTYKIALPDPLGQSGRPPTTGNVGDDGNVTTIRAPKTTDSSWMQTPYGRSMVNQYPYLGRSTQQWNQQREQALTAPPDQRPQAVQQYVREAGLLQQVKNNLRPKTYSAPRCIIAPAEQTNLLELDPKLIEDTSAAGLAAKEEARIASLVGIEKALVLIQRGQADDARQELIATVQNTPDDGPALNALTLLHLAARQDAPAVQSFIAALRLSPAFAELKPSDWGLSGPEASEAASRLTAQAKRTGGSRGAETLLLAAALRASQGQTQVARLLAEQAWTMDTQGTIEELVLGLTSSWPESAPAGNRKPKPAS